MSNMLPRMVTPEYDMIVPSTGESITYRPYTVKEEKILLIAMESQDEKQIENSVLAIINACITSDIDTNKLTTFDVEYMFVTLRSKSVGEGIELTPKCEECEEINNVKIELDKVTVENLNDVVDTHIKLTNVISVDLKWATMKDRNKDLLKESETETIINMVCASIETIYSGEETFIAADVPHEEIVGMVESLSPDQFNDIVDVLSQAPYLSYNLDFDCTKCGKENSIELKGLVDFFQ